jgi:Domain of Unknown Function (DUF1259)
MYDEKKEPTRREALFAGAGVGGLRVVAPALLGGLAPAVARSSPNDTTPLPLDLMNAVFGVEGMVEPGGVVLYDLPRTDLHPIIMGIPVDPDWGFDTEITFQPLGSRAVVKWEMCLLDREVDPVLQALFREHLDPQQTTLNALHNHFIQLRPKIKFLHGMATGDPVGLAQALRKALQDSHHPFVSSPPGDTDLPNDEIANIIGGDSRISGKVLTVTVPRKDTIHEFGIHLAPTMQFESLFNFQKIGRYESIVNAELVLTPHEFDAVARFLRERAFIIMAAHNHELFVEPRFYYIHTGNVCSPISQAKIIREALEKTNSKLK